jgi:hypothetical protein
MALIKLLGKTSIHSKTIFATENLTPTYAIGRSLSAVNEGSSVTFTLSTTNVANGTVLPYTISGISANDVTTGSLTGSFTVNSGLATTTITMSADQLTEGAETATLTLNNAAASNFVIVNDTSTTPVPLTISGLQLWLDAADSSTLFDATAGGSLVTTNGAAVGRWTDKSGNNRHAIQGIVNNRPVLKLNSINGKNTIQTTAQPRWLLAQSRFDCSGATVIAVYKKNSNGGNNNNANRFVEFSATSNGLQNDKVGFSEGLWISESYTVPTTNFKISVTKKSNIVKGGSYISLFGTLQHAGSSPWYVTGMDTDTVYYGVGEIAEVLIYNSSLTTGQTQTLQTYLSAKWGI